MSQITKFTMAGLILLGGLLFMAGCSSSDPNSNSPYYAASGHPDNWLPAGHMNSAVADKSACAECHGTDYTGGISGVSCDQCHLGGVNSVHPLDWGTSINSAHATYVNTNGNMACATAYCHGTNLEGVDNSGPSCTSCHLGGTSSIHPDSFGTGSQIILNHGSYVQTNGSSGCATAACHGTNLQGGVGPACTSCHEKGSPITLTGCTSCHTNPPSGTVYPDVKGAHTVHNALNNVTSVCNTCHHGAGTNTVNHYNGVVNVLFLSTYNAKSGSAIHNTDGTCSTVSCHGGKQTPAWLTGTINVNTQCTLCHVYGTAQATPEYNSFYSGEHDFHVNSEGMSCTECHDTTLLAVNHFTTLNTSTMEGPASATILNSIGYSGGSCSPGCHDTRKW